MFKSYWKISLHRSGTSLSSLLVMYESGCFPMRQCVTKCFVICQSVKKSMYPFIVLNFIFPCLFFSPQLFVLFFYQVGVFCFYLIDFQIFLFLRYQPFVILISSMCFPDCPGVILFIVGFFGGGADLTKIKQSKWISLFIYGLNFMLLVLQIQIIRLLLSFSSNVFMFSLKIFSWKLYQYTI